MLNQTPRRKVCLFYACKNLQESNAIAAYTPQALGGGAMVPQPVGVGCYYAITVFTLRSSRLHARSCHLLTSANSLDFVIDRFFMKLFKTNNIDTVRNCQEDLLLSCQALS